MVKSYGRLDYSPRLKLWRVVWYLGKTHEQIRGDFTKREDAASHLQHLISTRAGIGMTLPRLRRR